MIHRKDANMFPRYRMSYLPVRPSRRQRGFALMMALIFLMLITMLAISSSRHALLQQRMAGSLRNVQQARMSAETALRGVEYKMWSMARQPGIHLHCRDGALSSDDGCIIFRPMSPAYTTTGAVTTFQTAPGWISNIGQRYTGPARKGYTGNSVAPTATLAKDPMYIIEDLGSERPPGVGALHESGNTGPNNSGAEQVDIHIYRITARGTGGNPNVVSVVQSTFDAPVDL
jgi:type IV pilus assembly protein PilX